MNGNERVFNNRNRTNQQRKNNKREAHRKSKYKSYDLGMKISRFRIILKKKFLF